MFIKSIYIYNNQPSQMKNQFLITKFKQTNTQEYHDWITEFSQLQFLISKATNRLQLQAVDIQKTYQNNLFKQFILTIHSNLLEINNLSEKLLQKFKQNLPKNFNFIRMQQKCTIQQYQLITLKLAQQLQSLQIQHNQLKAQMKQKVNYQRQIMEFREYIQKLIFDYQLQKQKVAQQSNIITSLNIKIQEISQINNHNQQNILHLQTQLQNKMKQIAEQTNTHSNKYNLLLGQYKNMQIKLAEAKKIENLIQITKSHIQNLNKNSKKLDQDYQYIKQSCDKLIIDNKDIKQFLKEKQKSEANGKGKIKKNIKNIELFSNFFTETEIYQNLDLQKKEDNQNFMQLNLPRQSLFLRDKMKLKQLYQSSQSNFNNLSIQKLKKNRNPQAKLKIDYLLNQLQQINQKIRIQEKRIR